MPTKHKRISLAFPDDLYTVTKSLADASGMTLAGLITHLIRGASPVFPAMTDVINKGREYDQTKAIQLQSLLSQVIVAPASTEEAGADAHAQAGAVTSCPRSCNTGAKMDKRSKIYH